MALNVSGRPAGGASSPTRHDRRWLILAVIAVVQLMLVLDLTIVNIALPRAQRDLGFADGGRQWIVTAYTLSFGSLLLPGGRLGDLFGRKRTFIVGLVGFSAASVLGGAAPNFAVLTTGRALQGAFGALLAPSILGLLNETFIDAKDRRRAFAVFGAVAGAAGALGLLLGGTLTSYASWRWCLYVNVVFAAIAITGGVKLLQGPPRKTRLQLDLLGTTLAAVGLLGIVYGFSQTETHGWTSRQALLPLLVGAATLAGFVLSQRVVTHPLLPLDIPRDRTRGGACLIIALTNVSIFALFLFLTFYLQNVRGYSPVRTGFAFVPISIGIFVASTVTNVRLLPAFGSRAVLCFGLTTAGAGLLWLSRLHLDSSYASHVLPALIISGIGFGSIFGPANNAATTAVRPNELGAASALANTMQQVGASFGTSLMSTLAASATANYGRSHSARVAGAAARATVHGYVAVFSASAIILFIGAALGGVLVRGKPKRTRTSTVSGTRI